MFDRETHIRSNLQAHYNEAVQSGQMVFCLILQGSQNYGLDINNEKYQSDIDTKAIILPSFEDFCRGSASWLKVMSHSGQISVLLRKI